MPTRSPSTSHPPAYPLGAGASLPLRPRHALPPLVDVGLTRRRVEAVKICRGRVLDLGASLLPVLGGNGITRCDIVSPDPFELARERWHEVGVPVVTHQVPLTALSTVSGPFDWVVSIGRLATLADLPGALTSIRPLLADDGRLLVVEPTRGLSRLDMVLGSLTPLLPPVAGLHLCRDLPLALRACGYRVTDIERFTMPTPILPLRPWVQVTVRLAGGGAA